MFGLRRLNSSEWNKPPVLTVATAILMRRLGELYGDADIKQLAVIHNGQGLTVSERDASGTCNVYAAGGLVGTHREQLTSSPFVVIGRKGSAGKATYAPDGGWVIDTAYYAQPKNGNLNCEFLHYAISNCDFTGDVISTAIPGINRTAIYKHRIATPPMDVQLACVSFLNALATARDLPELPSPLAEQRRIVAKVERLAVKIEDVRGLREKSNVESMAILKSAIGDLPFRAGDWGRVESAVLDRKGTVRSGPFGSQLHHKEFVDSGVMAIGTRDVQVNQFVPTSGWYVTPEKFEEVKRYQAFPGDLLTTIVGASIGRFCVVPGDIPTAFTTKHIMAVTLDRAIANPTYCSFMLNYHPRCRDSIFSQCEGSAQPSLNSTKVKNTQLPLPPLAEQEKTVAYLNDLQEKVDTLKSLQAKTAAELDALLPSILDEAFKGEL